MHELQVRAGTAPEVIGPAPRGQTSHIPPIMVQEELWQRMRALPHIYMAPTLVSVWHARALFLPEGSATGRPRYSPVGAPGWSVGVYNTDLDPSGSAAGRIVHFVAQVAA